MNNKAPTWRKVGSALKELKVQQLFGGDILPEEFLKILFNNDPMLLKLIPDFKYRHHQVITMLMKEEYSLSNCAECGHYSRNIGFNWRRRFLSTQEIDEWEVEGSESQPSTPDTIRLQPEEDTSTSDTTDEKASVKDEEEAPKLKKCCKDFNPVF